MRICLIVFHFIAGSSYSSLERSDTVTTNIALFYSPPSNSETELQFEGSQLFHMDEEDNTLCKLWLLIDNVSESDGPTVIIKKGKSFEIASRLRYKKGQKISSDDELLKNVLELTNE
jgi:hypothetical protein